MVWYMTNGKVTKIKDKLPCLQSGEMGPSGEWDPTGPLLGPMLFWIRFDTGMGMKPGYAPNS